MKKQPSKFKQKGFVINPFITQDVANIDPYWNMAQLQLNGDEASIIDRSPMNCTVTPSAGVTVSNTRSKYGTTSIHVPNADNILCSKANCFSYQYGDFELHMDVWFENNVSGNTGFIRIRSDENYGRVWFMRNAAGEILFDSYGYGGSGSIATLPAGQWHSLVIGRVDQYFYVGINGVLYQLAVNQGSYGLIGNTTTGTIAIYGAAGGTGGLYFNNLRVLACRNYLSNTTVNTYTPPNRFYPKQGVDANVYDPLWKNVIYRSPVNLTSGVSDLSKLASTATITGAGTIVADAAGYDGYGFLNNQTDGAIRVWSPVPSWSNWTFEARFRWTGGFTTNDKRVILLMNNDTPVLYIQCSATGSIYIYRVTVTGWLHFNFTPDLGTLYNLCFQRNGSLISLFVNGNWVGQADVSNIPFSNVNNFIINGYQTTGQTCFVDDIRMTLGTRATAIPGYDSNHSLAHTQPFPIQGYN